MLPFSPCYILPDELCAFGLPTPDVQGDIMNTVQLASTLLDGECGRIDGDGNGSLVYTTYVQRILLQTRNRNLFMVGNKPIVGIPQATIDLLAASGAASGGNFYYTGVLANSTLGPGGVLSGIIGASGRYGYSRQDMGAAYPDLQALVNPLNLVTLFGGPAPWIPFDVANTDYDSKTGEIWIPAGLQLTRYNEVLIQYNSGYSPFNIPRTIKHVCAALVKNALGKGDGTTALLTMSMGGGSANATFTPKLLDPTLDSMLQPFRNVRAY